ncbi:DUF222 domain-containing protein [Frankia sp. CNm7]|uniref:DUF222 domain-containing protein n=1 Tax=Frankia nepalensis TaxID=1836974 RepID=A0A937RKD6_9ACTN|nr:HNH endonuclease signature motif containing protein [Frankia nepalensis]MBL7500072.1 DUF222 domain-containing protein [Frankia nepalensis]MBL7509394.1 DUF222 domain-containing protein [Frankia nepalensis]MBL7522847.1 DUF222 domain-containing protein [Frankia nepalensis]MBL7631887.1 DUF222 domain-containing protein [Frankia nepalensis]
MLAALDGALELVEGLLDAALWGLSEAETLEALGRAERLSRQVKAFWSRAVLDVSTRDVTPALHFRFSRPEQLIGELLSARSHDARRDIEIAGSLDRAYIRTRDALFAARISYDQAAIIVQALLSLPDDTPADQRCWTEAFLLEQAVILVPRDLARLGREIRARINDELHPPGGDPLDDGDQARRRELWLTDQGDGTTRLRGTLDAEGAATLRAALEPLTRPATPRTDNGSPDGPLTRSDGRDGPVDRLGDADHRTAAQRRADALVELADRVLGTGTLPTTHGTRPHLTVTATLDTLTAQKGALPAHTGYGLPLSRTVLERIACDTRLTTVLLSKEGIPLELGRTKRIVPPGLRKAVVARDGGCVFPQCDRPAEWCEVHHLEHWIDGGTTDLDNTALVCKFHHRLLHQGEWEAIMGPDRRPMLIPPAYIDYQRRPRRNPLHRTLHDLFTGTWEPPPSGGARPAG